MTKERSDKKNGLRIIVTRVLLLYDIGAVIKLCYSLLTSARQWHVAHQVPEPPSR